MNDNILKEIMAIHNKYTQFEEYPGQTLEEMLTYLTMFIYICGKQDSVSLQFINKCIQGGKELAVIYKEETKNDGT